MSLTESLTWSQRFVVKSTLWHLLLGFYTLWLRPTLSCKTCDLEMKNEVSLDWRCVLVWEFPPHPKLYATTTFHLQHLNSPIPATYYQIATYTLNYVSSVVLCRFSDLVRINWSTCKHCVLPCCWCWQPMCWSQTTPQALRGTGMELLFCIFTAFLRAIR
jgi:hypothetical protein